MAQNYADKYSPKVDERFKLGSLTDIAVNKDYDFVGVNAVNVYTINTVELGDYSMATGANRFGEPAEIDDAKQTLTLSQDKAFTFVIDNRNKEDSMGAKDAGKALRREIDEVIIPTIDKYRLATMVTGAGNATTAAAITSSNAYDKFLEAESLLTDDMVPVEGRIAYVSPTFYKAIKQDNSFILASEMGQEMLAKGVVGMIDGVKVVLVPTSYLPKTVEFIITHKDACVSPVKLATYRVNTEPQGIDGALVEGRIYYDAFILNNKANAIAVHKNA